MLDFSLTLHVWTIVATLVAVLFYDVPIKNFFRWVRGLTRKKT